MTVAQTYNVGAPRRQDPKVDGSSVSEVPIEQSINQSGIEWRNLDWIGRFFRGEQRTEDASVNPGIETRVDRVGRAGGPVAAHMKV